MEGIDSLSSLGGDPGRGIVIWREGTGREEEGGKGWRGTVMCKGRRAEGSIFRSGRRACCLGLALRAQGN
jgi:hypothetical protein